MKPTKKQIRKQMKLARKHEGVFSGDTYENGVLFAIEWMLGKSRIKPMAGWKKVLWNKAKEGAL